MFLLFSFNGSSPPTAFMWFLILQCTLGVKRESMLCSTDQRSSFFR